MIGWPDHKEEPEMHDDDTDSGGDFFIDMVKTVLAVGFFLLFVVTVGAVVWGFVA